MRHSLRLSLITCCLAGSAFLGAPALAQATLMAWGTNTSGQTNVPAPPPGVSYQQVAAGTSHSLGLLGNETVLAWGSNTSGQLDVPALPAGVSYTAVAASTATSFATRSDGEIVAWGASGSGLLVVPTLLPSTVYNGVFSGPAASHVLATRNDGWLAAWGANGSGQCNTPSLPAGLAYARAAAGSNHSLGLRNDGSVVAWGSNSNGQTSVPSLPGGLIYIAVAAGDRFSLALRSNGTIAAWGLNGSGQLAVPSLPPGLHYSRISAAQSGGYALRSDGVVVHWGAGTSAAPTATLTKYTSISAGGSHALGIRRAVCAGLTYCTAKTNLIGCVPTISYSGTPSFTGADDFYITASNLSSQQAGMVIWSTGSYAAPFFGGTLCVAPPIVRTTPQISTGPGAPFDCTGTFALHFSQAYMAAQGLLPGTLYYAQYWMRDYHDPLMLSVGLTNGLQFMLCE